MKYLPTNNPNISTGLLGRTFMKALFFSIFASFSLMHPQIQVTSCQYTYLSVNCDETLDSPRNSCKVVQSAILIATRQRAWRSGVADFAPHFDLT